MSNPLSVSASGDAWEYASPSLPLDVTVDPEDDTKPKGPVHWWQTLAEGDVTFVTPGGRSVTFTGLTAGDVLGVQAVKFTAAPGGLRVGWGQ